MRAVNNSTALVIQPRSSWRQNAMLSLAAFALTVVAVHSISRNFSRETSLEKGSKAVAILEQKTLKGQNDFPKNSVLGSSFHLKNIKTRVLSLEFIEQALRDCGIEISPISDKRTYNASSSFVSLEQLRQGLTIRIKHDVVWGENQIILELTLKQSPDASRIARALADRFVCEYRTFWAAESQKDYLAVSAQADQAQQAYREAVKKLKAFKESASKQEEITPEQQPLQTPTAQQTTPQNADNPAWTELNNRLASLRQQEDGMLVNKTSSHPDVQHIRGLIADIEQQLAVTPRFTGESLTGITTQKQVFLAPNSASPLDKENQDSHSSEEIAAGIDQNEISKTLKHLQGVVKYTEQEYLKTIEREKQAFEAGQKEPYFSIDVKPLAIASTAHKSNRKLVELMLFSGFAMAVGMSVFSSGVAMEPVLATIADLEPLMPAPIIGVVPGKDPSFNPLARRRLRAVCRWTMILLGGCIVLGCIGRVYWFFTHLV